MAKHIKPSSSLIMIENNSSTKSNILEETMDSKKLSVNQTTHNVPLFNGHTLETKLSESEAKISKLISEIDLLKTKVSWNIYLYKLIKYFIFNFILGWRSDERKCWFEMWNVTTKTANN